MKTNEKLLHLLGEVNDSFVPGAVTYKPKKVLVRWATLGGSICAAALVAVIALHKAPPINPPVLETPIVGTNRDTSAEYSSIGNLAEVPSTAAPSFEEILLHYRIYPEYHLESTSQELSVIPSQIVTDGMGSIVSIFVYDISEQDNANPWSENLNLSTLPVFRNLAYAELLPGLAVYFSEAEMNTMLEKVTYILGLTVEHQERISVKDYYVADFTQEFAEAAYLLSATCSGTAFGSDTVKITVKSDGTITIDFSPAIPLPSEYSFTKKAEVQKTLAYLTDRFQNLLQLENPVISIESNISYPGNTYLYSEIFNASENPVESILNYNFCPVTFSVNENGSLSFIRLTNLLCSSECIGEYPIITAEEAKSLLLDGNYISSFTEELSFTEDLIVKTELMYQARRDNEFFLPYYRFYVNLTDQIQGQRPQNTKRIGLFYVPAIRSEYLEDFPIWDGSIN